MSTSSAVGRIAAILALIGALVVVLLLLIGGGSSYKVTAELENASQLVNGNSVSVAGVPAGKVAEIKLADNGQALVEMEVDEEYAPLKFGTTATVRSQSISGIANRYIELQMPEGDKAGEEIESGGVIDASHTVSEVDLDELFNSLDEPTIAGLKGVIKGFARAYDGVGPQTNAGFYYFNPFLSTSRRVFGELNADEAALERLVVDGASLTSALAERDDDIDKLVDGGSKALGAIGRQDQALADSVAQLPDFMRQFNTTAFNLRAALDDVDPLVNASKPVVKKLIPFSQNLRGFARDAVPTIDDLDNLVKADGADNDLIDLSDLQPALGEIAAGPVNRNGESRQGALPAAAQALQDGLPALESLRPYVTTNGVSGWFDDFGHGGVTDANGGIGRIGTTFNAFSLSVSGIPILDLNGLLDPSQFISALDTNNLERCPGALERGQTDDELTYDGEIACDPSQRPTGP